VTLLKKDNNFEELGTVEAIGDEEVVHFGEEDLVEGDEGRWGQSRIARRLFRFLDHLFQENIKITINFEEKSRRGEVPGIAE